MLRLLALMATFGAGLAPAAGDAQAAARHDWISYKNERFGFSLLYPADILTPTQTSAAGDGELFVSDDGRARLLVGAIENSERHSPASYQRFIARESYLGYAVDYSPSGRTWSVLSGERDDSIFYEKALFSCGGWRIASFAMLYPVAERRVYDPIVERIEDTFRAGKGEVGCP